MQPRSKLLRVTACVVLLPAATLAYLAAQQPATAPAAPPAGAPRPTAAPAGQPGSPGQPINLELVRGQRAKVRLAIPAFAAGGVSPAGGTAVERELEQTLRDDLQSSGYFDLQGPEAFRLQPLTGDVKRDLPAFASLGNELVLLGNVRHEAGKLVLEGRLYDVGSGNVIMAKAYRGPDSVVRRMAHTLADDVVRHVTGRPGIALSTIAFSSDRTSSDPEHRRKEIFIMDYDGHNQRRVTSHQSTSLSPAWNPAGDAIAYTSFVNGAPGIFVADLVSGRKQPLITSGSFNASPSFSPDGSQIAFARSVAGNIDIFVADKNGHDLRRLTSSPAIDTNPAWSPKGGQIAFTSDRAGGNLHIYLMDAEGADQRRITSDSPYDDGAAWSPDGGEITYTSRRNGSFQIAVTNVATLATRVLTAGSRNESPAFSPDGRKIVFTSDRGGSKQLYVMDAADGGNVRQLTDAGANDLADWSRHNNEKSEK
jgi:TolB protein